ncbi:hypothetical protein [Streptomyces longisporoflavus]|uniref:Uncharacterized protein n=1 Tax=Streptomyces longisporoflavus TaxID=28044 RepID=A0ABW7QWG0_9ACTN|nr:hypothetical protein [Streptomyces longisporoflavus]GGV35711.1 hypothetical protein GCM10010277_21730 [Streptomyces longisporoflavus]
MAVLAVFIPVVMLGVVLALGRYEEWLLASAAQVKRVAQADEAEVAHRAA